MTGESDVMIAATALQSLCLQPDRGSKIVAALWDHGEVVYRVMQHRHEASDKDMHIGIYTRSQLPSSLLEEADTYEKMLRELDYESKTGSMFSAYSVKEEEATAAELGLRPLPPEHTLGIGGKSIFLPVLKEKENRTTFFEVNLQKCFFKRQGQAHKQVLEVKFGDGKVWTPHFLPLHYYSPFQYLIPNRLPRTHAKH